MKNLPSNLKLTARTTLTAVLLGTVSANGQGQASRAAADRAWADVLTQATAAASVAGSAGTKKTTEEKNAQGQQQAARSREAAQAAKIFYTRFPNDANAAAAKKVEAISMLRGVRAGDAAQELAAVAIAQTYRGNPANSAKDRFDVALLMDRQNLSLKVAARTVANTAAEEKKLVENWRTEFGHLPEIETYAMRVAHRADPATAVALAAQVARSPVASAAAKAEAKSLRARASLLGSGLNLKVPLVGGGEVDLAQPPGKITVLVVWSPSEPAGLQALEPFKKSFPGGVRLVCLAVGGTRGEVMRVRRTVPDSALYGHVPAGEAARTTGATLQLRSAPYVYVLNRAGVLADFGPLSELPALLLRAGVASRNS